MTDFNAAAETAKAAPAVAVTGWSLSGLPLPEAIQLATLVYLALQITLAVKKLIGGHFGKGSREGK